VNITVNVLLVIWTVRFSSRRLEKYQPPAAS